MGKSSPPDGQYTRKGERDGPKLTPGERALNWAKVIAVIVPLIGIGAVANEPVKRWIGLAEVDHRTEVSEGETFEQSVIRFSEETQAEIDKLKARDDLDDHEIKQLIYQIDKRLQRIEKLVN